MEIFKSASCKFTIQNRKHTLWKAWAARHKSTVHPWSIRCRIWQNMEITKNMTLFDLWEKYRCTDLRWIACEILLSLSQCFVVSTFENNRFETNYAVTANWNFISESGIKHGRHSIFSGDLSFSSTIQTLENEMFQIQDFVEFQRFCRSAKFGRNLVHKCDSFGFCSGKRMESLASCKLNFQHASCTILANSES